MILRTSRLLLRDFVPTDLQAYSAVREHTSEPSPGRSAELLHRFVEWSLEKPRLRFQLAIEKPAAGLIGSCGVRITSEDQAEASFGCELARKHRGKGYALEAGRAIIDFAFAELGLHRIHAETLARNRSALMLARRLGMRVEGHQEDTVRLAILAAEWKAEG